MKRRVGNAISRATNASGGPRSNAKFLGETIQNILPIREPVRPGCPHQLCHGKPLPKKYVLEYSSGHCFLVTPNHKHPVSPKKQRRSIVLPTSAFAQLKATLPMTISNGDARAIFRKDFLAAVLFPNLTSGLRIKESRAAWKFSIDLSLTPRG
jgi:hypothetical protein